MALSSSLGIINNSLTTRVGIQKRCDDNRVVTCSIAIGDWTRSKVMKGRIYAVVTTNEVVQAQEMLDRWMRESVVEIVKNLKEAPLLVQVYSKKKDETTRLATKKVDDWETVKERREIKETPMSEGDIFVDELGEDKAENGGDRGLKERTTKM